jgi:predicted amidohydrolase
VRVAAYQAPLAAAWSRGIIGHIEQRVRWCQSEGIAILCCPEGIIGGLADYCDQPAQCAIRVANRELENVLAPLRSGSVTLIIGFKELGSNNELYNAAAVLQQGRLAGIYRKLHLAIRQSVYSAGSATPVFRAGGAAFGVVIRQVDYEQRTLADLVQPISRYIGTCEFDGAHL